MLLSKPVYLSLKANYLGCKNNNKKRTLITDLQAFRSILNMSTYFADNYPDIMTYNLIDEILTHINI